MEISGVRSSVTLMPMPAFHIMVPVVAAIPLISMTIMPAVTMTPVTGTVPLLHAPMVPLLIPVMISPLQMRRLTVHPVTNWCGMSLIG
jgi:hypothetical protein